MTYEEFGDMKITYYRTRPVEYEGETLKYGERKYIFCVEDDSTEIVYDCELVGSCQEDGKGFEFLLYETEGEPDSDGITRINILPKYRVVASQEDVAKEIGGDFEEVEGTIKEFMGDRFKYNTRIRSNMGLFEERIKNHGLRILKLSDAM